MIKSLAKEIVKLFVKLVMSIVKLGYLIVKGFDTLVGKLFMKLPRLAKVGVVYTMVTLSVLQVLTFTQPKVVENVKAEVENTTQEVISTDNQSQEEVIEDTTTETQQTSSRTFENQVATDIYNKALEVGATEEQALIMVSISQHETGSWTSTLYKESNNFGGICNSKGFNKYDSYESGLNAFVNLLKNNYFDKGLTTIEQIGNKYCPVGAENDPTGLNKNWIPSVTSIYNSYNSK